MSAPPSPDSSGAAERGYRAAQLVRDRLAAGAPEDDPITREAIAVVVAEFKAQGAERKLSARAASLL